MTDLVREIMIDATPETIWPFLVEPDRHVEWLGTVADIDPRPGGHYRVLVNGRHQSVGEYVEVVPNERVLFTFGWAEDGNPITPGSDHRRDLAASRGHQDARASDPSWTAGGRRQRSLRRMEPLRRAAGDRRDRR